MLRRVEQTRTIAALIAGRVIDSMTLRHGTMRQIAALIERDAKVLGPDLIALVAGDTTDYDGKPKLDDEPIYNRLVVGLRIHGVDADEGPSGPISKADLIRAHERASELLTPLFWRRIAEC